MPQLQKKCVGGRKFADIVRYSKSQRKEDLHVMKWFGNLCNGTYIEMGALNGVLGSNSIVFNKSELHWRGVLIELIKENYDELVVNRPDEIATIHSCVCGKKQMLHTVAQSRVNRLVSQGSTGGIFEFAAPSFRQHWWGGNTLDEIRASDRVGYVSEVDCDTLDNLLLEHAENVTFFDFFSLDVEGAELEILKSVDFNRVGFGIIFAEADNHNTTKNLEIKTLLESEGYHFWGDMLGSYWFLNSDFFDIYKGLL